MERRSVNAVLAIVVVLLGTRVATREQVAKREQVFVHHYTPRDQETQRYAYVPIDVAAEVTAITIDYSYDAKSGANAIDLGLFEPGSLALGSKALRGWSGGARGHVTVGVAEATPGYWPGPIQAGQWHLVLGLYRVAPDGVDVTVTVAFSRDAAMARALPARLSAPLRRGPGWFTGVLHAHTTESDGALTVPQLIDKAEGERLDFLAITDHNNTTHQLFPLDRPNLLVITGEEVTTPAGHFNVWGLGGARDFVDFRISAGTAALAKVMRAAHERGGVISINHPVSDCLACTWTHRIPESVDAIEIANGAEDDRRQAMGIWDTLLRSGRRITAVEGRDWHRGNDPLGAPVLRVWADQLSSAGILDAIRQGRAIVMANAAVPVPGVTISAAGQTATIGDTLTIAGGEPMMVEVVAPGLESGAHAEWVWNGETLVSAPLTGDGRARFERVAQATGYARVHVVSADGRPIAITNPIWVKVR